MFAKPLPLCPSQINTKKKFAQSLARQLHRENPRMLLAENVASRYTRYEILRQLALHTRRQALHKRRGGEALLESRVTSVGTMEATKSDCRSNVARVLKSRGGVNAPRKRRQLINSLERSNRHIPNHHRKTEKHVGLYQELVDERL